jgi:aminoglycoside phosphotransferase (APT) family kinase protein
MKRSADVRCLPPVELEVGRIQEMLAPMLAGGDVLSVERLDDGLVNTVYRVLAAPNTALALRIYASGIDAFERERQILSRASPRIPAPEILLAGVPGEGLPYPYVVYRWVDGITLNDCRRQFGPAALLSLAEPLARLLADVATISVKKDVAAPVEMSAVLAEAEARLRDGWARVRLGSALADALRNRLEAAASRLGDADRMRGLAHGDFGGRNVIVSPTDDGAWRVAALLDWEHAFTGATLWDIGSLFRYAHRYSTTFRDRFELGYRSAGGKLPDDWYQCATLLDATRLIGILSEERDLPSVFAECRDLVSSLVAV